MKFLSNHQLHLREFEADEWIVIVALASFVLLVY